MKILIIEDDMNKIEQIEAFLKLINPDIHTTVKKSYQSGLREIIKSHYDLIVLDMSLPTYDISPKEEGGPFLTYAGEEILQEMMRRNITSKVIVATQFDSFGEGQDAITLDQLRDRLSMKFKDNYLKSIYYEASEKNWKDEILSIVESILKK